MSAEGRHIGGVMGGGEGGICPRTGSQSVCKAAIAQLVVPSGITPRVCLLPVQSLLSPYSHTGSNHILEVGKAKNSPL